MQRGIAELVRVEKSPSGKVALLEFRVAEKFGFREGQFVMLEARGVTDYPHVLSGSIRGYFVHTELKDAYPERYARIVEAFENISSNPEAIEAHVSQNLTIDWMGPDAGRAMMLREHASLARPEFLSIVQPD